MPSRTPRLAAWFAVAWSATAYVALLFLPTSSTSTTTSDGAVFRGSRSIAESGDSRVFISLAIPLAVAMLALIAVRTHQRWLIYAAALAATLFAMLALASVGMFYLPVALALVVAAVTTADQESTG